MSLANTSFQLSPHGNAVRLWGQLGVLTLLIVAAYWFAIENLIHRWGEEQEYSHGFLIPVVSAWMIWSRRKALESVDLKPSWFGLLVLAGSGLLAILGIKTGVLTFQQIALVTSLFGVALVVGGWRLTRILAVPIAFLFFMVPLPPFLTSTLSWRMQLVASELGVAFIRMFDIPVFLDGNIIDLGVYKLGVVEACSGLRYLFPFLSLGFLAAYTVDLAFWKKVLVCLSVIPITIVMNSLRIGFIGILVHFYGIEHAEGFIHYFEGWVVFIFCIAILIAEIYIFGWLSGAKQIELFRFPEFSVEDAGPERQAPRGFGMRTMAWPVAAGLMIAIVGTVGYADSDAAMAPPESARLIGLPYDVEGWSVESTVDLDARVEGVLGADDYVGADLVSETGDRVNLFVAYIERKRGRQTWHSPQQCIPGGGWKIKSLDRVELTDSFTGRPYKVNRVLIERNGVHQLVYYWFQQRGRRIASEWTVRYYVMLDSLLKGRTDGALVRLVTAIPAGQDIAGPEARLKDFAAEMSKHLPQYVPE